MFTKAHVLSELVSQISWLEQESRPITGLSPGLALKLGLEEGSSLNGSLNSGSLECLSALMETLSGGVHEVLSLEGLQLTDAEGQDIWLQMTFTEDAERGGFPAITAAVVDCTARFKAEQALREKSERLELVVEGTRLGTWDWNPQTNEVSFGDYWAEMLGYSSDEVASSLQEWESRVHPDDLEACFKDIGAHISGETDYYENVHRMKHKDGHWVYILDRGKVVERDAEGRPTRFTGTHTDITAQKVAELKANEAAEAKSQFLATMSHEIRTPMNGILGLLQVLEGTQLDEKQADILSTMKSCGDHLLILIDDVLNLSRIEAGELRLDPRPFQIQEVSGIVSRLYFELAEKKGVRFSSTVKGNGAAWIVADSHRLVQLLSNLVSNAVKFTDVGSVSLEMGVENAGGGMWLEASVADTGKGIEDKDAIWGGFCQEQTQISRKYGGSGLGLTITRELIELMGGTIDLTSAPGAGSTFTIRVPVGEVEAGSLVSAPKPVIEEKDYSGLRVLVAEDNPVNRKVIELLFEKLHLSPDIACDGAEALEMCRQSSYDLVLMDVHMPVMDGLESTSRILAELGAKAPVIYALTADVVEQSRKRCLEIGMEGFIEKPVRLHVIEEALKSVSSRI